MPTNDERREAAAKLREPFDVLPQGGYYHASHTLFGMGLYASSEGALRLGVRRLADLIAPEERTCHIEPLSLHEFFAGEKYILSRGARESAEDECFDRLAREIEKDACFMCSNCHVLFGTREAANADYDILEDGTYEVGNVAPLIKFCPNCGAKVIQE